MAALAGQQHGVVSRWQLLELGMSCDQIQDRATGSRLHRLHRGVYAVGHRKLTLKGIWMAAVLACGPESLLSHRPALALWDLRRRETGLIDVTVPSQTGRRGPTGLRMHKSALLTGVDAAVVDGIPVTSLAWTLVDFAGIAQRQQVRSVLETLERRGDYIGGELDELLQRAPSRKGVRTLRLAIADLTGPAPWLQSELEEFFRELIRDSDLPDYEANAMVEGMLVDALWRRERLIVELDGFAFHKSRRPFEEDRRRDAKLQIMGYRVLRITQWRLTHEPEAVLADIRALLNVSRAA
jgi:very-short-patch-repair endonuclease